jgi:hypothetical protein
VDVAHRAIHRPRRDLEQPDVPRAVEVAAAARQDLRVARAALERRQPARLELEPDRHEHVGLVELQHEARLGVDEVRILRRQRERGDRHLVAAHLAGERGEVRHRGDDLDLRRRGGAEGGDGGGGDAEGADHRTHDGTS